MKFSITKVSKPVPLNIEADSLEEALKISGEYIGGGGGSGKWEVKVFMNKDEE